MINFTTEDTNKGKRLIIEGEATIEHNGKLHEYVQKLLQETSGTEEIELSLKKTKRIDVAFLQVIQSLKTSLSEKAIALTVPLSKMEPDVRNMLELTGFCRQFCGEEC